MAAFKDWLYATTTPVLAFAAFFSGFYALLISTSRVDWALVAAAAVATIAAAIGAFVVRKVRPNLALALVTGPGLLLFAVLAWR